MKREKYQRPEIVELLIVAERGFLGSVEGQVEDFNREEWNE